ncbi:MAG TPA: hypothetical protein VGO93_00325 [Candidatus Xenobia bacterium]|jgi:hypothetical protein
MGLVDDLMDEIQEEAAAAAAANRDPLPWRSPDYKPTPEAIASFQTDIGPIDPPENEEGGQTPDTWTPIR